MKKLLLCFLYSVLAFSQKDVKRDSIPAIQIKLLNANYKDFIVIEKSIYAITKGDSLIIFDIHKDVVKKITPKVYAIAKTSQNDIYYITEQGNINQTRDFNELKTIGKINCSFSQLLVDRNDDYIVITDRGIEYKNISYKPKAQSRIYQSRYKSDDRETKFLSLPTFAYTDQKQRIWLTYDEGEFGSYIWLFDLNSKEFFESDYLYLKNTSNKKDYYKSKEYTTALLDSFPDKIKRVNDKLIYKFPNNIPVFHGVKGISENKKGEIFVSSSLMHFFVSGELSILKETDVNGFYDSFNINQVLEFQKVKGVKRAPRDSRYLNEYIGTNSFNIFDNSFYYYSDKGFFKIIQDEDEYSKQFIFRPWITWTAGLAQSVGYQMNVIKFEFISEKEIIFLTSDNGIGYFDGKAVKYFK